MTTVAEQIVISSTFGNVDINKVIELSTEQCVYPDQVWDEGIAYYYFVDNSGLTIDNSTVETF